MGARDLLSELAGAGLSVTADGDRLVIQPASLLTDHMRAALRAAKPELLALLAQPNRPYKLTTTEADAAHARPWDDATIARFVALVRLFMQRGMDAIDADDLAERLHLRDVRRDDRVCCVECSHYWPGRCANHRCAGLLSPKLCTEVAATMQRCEGFRNGAQP